jgi:hypothetical protein
MVSGMHFTIRTVIFFHRYFDYRKYGLFLEACKESKTCISIVVEHTRPFLEMLLEIWLTGTFQEQ